MPGMFSFYDDIYYKATWQEGLTQKESMGQG